MPRPPSSLRAQLAAFSIVRTVLNTGYRMVYPFLPALARGLGVDLRSAALAVTARSSLGAAAPLFGWFADRYGRRPALLLALLLSTAALGAVAAWPTYPVFFLSLMLAAAAKMLFDTATQAYIGDRVAYRERGLAIALTEFGWSGAFLIGMPLCGLAIGRAGWSAPFAGLAVLALLSAVVLWRMLPLDPPPAGARPAWSAGLGQILRAPPALAGLGVGVLISTANEVINIVYGAHMEQSFGLRVAALGAATALIGLSELSGEGLVAALADRLGKRRAVAWGVALNIAAALALPALAATLPGALAGLFLFYLTFEFTLVSAIPLMTELVPAARATLMAGNLAAHSTGRALGAWLGPLLYAGGLRANTLAAAAFDLAAIALLLALVREAVEPALPPPAAPPHAPRWRSR